MTSSDRKLRTEKPVTPFVLPLGPGTSSTLAGPFGPPRKGKRRRKNKHVVKNSRLWSTINTKDKGCGDLQDQKWMNMGTEEGQGEEHPCQCPMLPGGMWGAGGGCLRVLCPQSWRSGDRDRTTGNGAPPTPFCCFFFLVMPTQSVQLEPGESWCRGSGDWWGFALKG